MENVTVKKDALLDILTSNREAHRQLFLEAQEVYREKVIEALDERLQAVRRGDRVSTFFNLPEPRDFTDAFDRAISMVQWNVGETIELSEHDFQRYVLNDWEWAQQFVASTQLYTGS